MAHSPFRVLSGINPYPFQTLYSHHYYILLPFKKQCTRLRRRGVAGRRTGLLLRGPDATALAAASGAGRVLE
jgi:hypothetical protein